jgi:hypothetical protein
MDNTGREELLLEVIKDFTSITYPEYADEDNIKEKIYDYMFLLKKFKENPDEFRHDNLTKLNKLHQFFYGVSFDPENPNSNIYKTPIFDTFNLTYQKIDKLINETNNINADLLKSLLNIISVYYDPSKNKDAIVNEYLDNVIIPVVNKYKGIGVVADSSLKEENVEKIKKSLKSNIGKSDENAAPVAAPAAKAPVAKAAANAPVANAPAAKAPAANAPVANAPVANAPVANAPAANAPAANAPAAKDAKEDKDAKEGKKGKEDKKVKDGNDNLNDSKIINLLKLSDANDDIKTSNDDIKTSNDDIKTSNGNFNINDFDYDKLKEYLQALYLQLEIDSSKKEFINEIKNKINDLKIIDLEDFNSDKTKYINLINDKIIKHLNDYGFNINDFFEKNNDDILKILSLFKVNKKGNYITSYKLYSNNLKILNKLFYYPNPKEINDDFYKNQLKFLINKLTENNDNILDIIENIRLLINLIIEHKKKIYDINFSIQINECKIDDLPDTYKKILKLLNLLLKNDDFNSNVNGNILKGGGGDDDKILSEKKINDINLNLLFTLIKDKKDKDDKDDIVKIYKLIIIDDKNKEDIKNLIDEIFKIDTIDLKKTIIIEFNKNINRIFKDEKDKDITEENIIKNFCNKTFNLETIINKKNLKDLINLKVLASGYKFYYYKGSIISKKGNIVYINNIEQLLSIKDFCTIKYYIYPENEVKFQDIIYIENSNYNLPIIYDDKRNDSYDIIELIFDLLNNDIDNKSKIKKLLLDFDKDFKDIHNIISELNNLNINTNLQKPEKIDKIVKEITNITDTKKCFDYMTNNINYYKTKIAGILSNNPPKFYLEKSSNPNDSFDIDKLFKNPEYVSDDIVNKDFLNLKIKENIYDDIYYPIQQYITLKNLEYVQKNETIETTYCFCYDEKNFYNKEAFINEIIKRIRNDNLNLEDYINIKYKFKNNNNVFNNYYYLKKYKCKLKDILTLKSNQSFNYFVSSDEPIYNFDNYLFSTYNFYKFLYFYFLNEKIEKNNYTSKIYVHCKNKIKDFISHINYTQNLLVTKPIELDFFENIEEAKENLEDKLKYILKKKIVIDNNKSYEEIILEQLKINNDLLKYIDIKKFNYSSILTTKSENKNIQLLNTKINDFDLKYSINFKSNTLSIFRKVNGEFNIKDFLILKKDNFNIRKLLIKISASLNYTKVVTLARPAAALTTTALTPTAPTAALNAYLNAVLTSVPSDVLNTALTALASPDADTSALVARRTAFDVILNARHADLNADLDAVLAHALAAASSSDIDYAIVASPSGRVVLANFAAYLNSVLNNDSPNILAVYAKTLANRPIDITNTLKNSSPAALTAALTARPKDRLAVFAVALTATSPNTLTDTLTAAFTAALTTRRVIKEVNEEEEEEEDEDEDDNKLPEIFEHLDNNNKQRRNKRKVKVKEEFEEEEEENYGGFKNIIELEDVFKLYYNSDESINNIYKLYFIINIYGFYYQDDKEKYGLIENILEIIKIDIFNDDIIETIKNLITTIYHKTREIYEYYIRYFDKTDKIIKNYCKTRDLINKYLNMNFIYEFYKNYQKKDIKIDVNINGTILNIDKSLTDIKTEIDELFINGECLFPQSSYQISINPYDNEIDNFIHFIYDFTKNQSTFSLTNLNDLNAFIVLQLLSNENDMINLVINGETYMIKNINNHPYKLYIIENFNIQIILNDVQMGLYKQLFEMNNRRSLLGILAKEYYYLDFNIQKRSKFKFNLNYEIIPFISLSKIDDDFKRTIINYNSFKPMMIDEIKDLSILSLEKNGLIFLINYGILLASTIFSQINIKNFISLIHIYLNIKNNTKRFLNLYNYKGDNQTLIIYRDYIKSINYISFLESVLYLMRNKIDLKIGLKNFIKSVINFKENHFIIPVIKIDENFLQSLYNNKSYKNNEKIVEDFYLSFLLIYKNCLKGKINNNIIKMFHIFIIPNLRYFHNKIDIRDIENEVLDIKASEYIRLIRGIRGGDGDNDKVVNKPENQLNEINIEKAKKELKENDNVVLTTDLSDNTKDILKLLQVFNDFYLEFSKLDLNKLLKDFEDVINELFFITESTGESKNDYYIISDNKLDLFDEKLNYKENKKNYETTMRSIRNKVIDNIRNLEEVIKNFSYFLFKDKEKAGNLNDKAKNLAKILDYIETIEKSLIDEINGIKKFKDKSVEVNNVFLEFFPLDETQVPLMDNIKEFVTYYKKKIDKFLSHMSEAKVKYDNFKESLLDHDKKAQAYFAEEERTELNAISERIQELKSKKNEINSNKNKLKAEQEKLNEKIDKIKSKIDVENKGSNPNKDYISTYNKEIEAYINDIDKIKIDIEKLEANYKEIEKEINTLRSSKKVGGKKPLKEMDKNIKDLLDKNDIPFKNKDENVSFEDRKNEIKKRFDNIKKDYRKLKVSTYIPNSVNKDMILEKFINKKGDTLFEQILNNYEKDVKEKNQDIAKANFYESVDNNNLDPIKELEITFIDKLIFAFLIIFLRYAGLYITYRFIDNKFVKSIKEAIIYYSLSYVAVLFAFLFIVNIDLFRLRIIFNYCNLHINSTGILSHMIIKIIIGYVIYLLIVNLDNEPIPTYLSKNQNIKLKKKLDILTMIVVVFLLIFVLII